MSELQHLNTSEILFGFSKQIRSLCFFTNLRSFSYMPYPCSLAFSLSLLFQLLHRHVFIFIFISNVFCKNTVLCIQVISSRIPYFSPGPLIQKGIFLTCMCLHSQDFHCWRCHPMTSFLSGWGEWPLKGIWRSPGCLAHYFLPVILFGVLPATPVQGDWQPAYKLLWGPCLDGKDVGVLVDDAAVWMELFYLFIYHYHYNFIIITASFLV